MRLCLGNQLIFTRLSHKLNFVLASLLVNVRKHIEVKLMISASMKND